ncbi:retron system putative HNH endonuclease [Maridesulfovibrio sp.]|uniref:retron system putative HNH endonuclease n=1 Tax=Maridesulfovibrio sp. TaxID=2795000 RepID=UPI002AA6CE08|nr:retron system putative HNH endonuclease [Maridesulfovibrio sp.]
MRNIHKRAIPRKFREWKEENNHHLKDLPFKAIPSEEGGVKDDLRKALCEEQGYLCCYCQNQISDDADGMRVEHWACQRKNVDKRFEYGNLLAACCGSEGQGRKNHHCDVLKASSDLKYNPADFDVESVIKYKANGEIYSIDKDFNEQLGSVNSPGILNLNLRRLRMQRQARIDAVIGEMPKKGSWPREKILRKISEYETPGENGKLKSFSGVAIYYLKKKLR